MFEIARIDCHCLSLVHSVTELMSPGLGFLTGEVSI